MKDNKSETIPADKQEKKTIKDTSKVNKILDLVNDIVEQKEGNYFFDTFCGLVRAAEKYLTYIDNNKNDLSNKDFHHLMALTKALMTVNVKQIIFLLKRLERDKEFTKKHRLLLVEIGKLFFIEHNRVAIAQILRNPLYNNEREMLRYSLGELGKDIYDNQSFLAIGHLERFLNLDEDSVAITNIKKNVNEYIRKNQKAIKKWAKMTISSFKKFAGRLNAEDLKRLEEELSSIDNKPYNLYSKYGWTIGKRNKKLNLVRDLRYKKFIKKDTTAYTSPA